MRADVTYHVLPPTVIAEPASGFAVDAALALFVAVDHDRHKIRHGIGVEGAPYGKMRNRKTR